MLSAAFHFDLAVVGGGPAGTSAAITAARAGAKVVLFEARDFPRHKVCGEFVSAEALDLLAELLRDLPAGRALLEAAPRMDRTRLFFGERKIEARLSPAAASITRYNLDAYLWQAAQAAGVEARTLCEVSDIQGGGPFDLTASCGKFSTGALIVAAGRWSQFTPDRTVPPGPRWIGLKGHFHDSAATYSTDLYFFDGGYCGVQPVAKDVVAACAMVRSDCATTLPETFRQHSGLLERSERWTAVSQPVTTAPLIFREAQPVRGAVMYAGDAAAFIDPFVGDGISIALRSGQLAAEFACQFISGRTGLEESAAGYQREYKRQFAPVISTASRVRSLLSLSGIGRMAAFQLLRLPGVMPYLIRKTRRGT